jgi:hypothetical protein
VLHVAVQHGAGLQAVHGYCWKFAAGYRYNLWGGVVCCVWGECGVVECVVCEGLYEYEGSCCLWKATEMELLHSCLAFDSLNTCKKNEVNRGIDSFPYLRIGIIRIVVLSSGINVINRLQSFPAFVFFNTFANVDKRIIK